MQTVQIEGAEPINALIHKGSIMKVSYLGPKGTFTEQACISLYKDAERVPVSTFFEALVKVQEGIFEKCVVAIENSTEGIVNTTLDPLVFDVDLFIDKLIIIPIKQNILVKKGTEKEMIQKIISHPQALAQCRRFTRAHFPGAVEETSPSTAEAARVVSESSGEVAAIGPLLSAEIYDLEVLFKSAQDNNTNRTHFISVGKEDTSEPKEGCITTIAFSTINKPGELYRILDIFSLWDINMVKISSRPMRNKPGEYIFVVDIENNNPEDVKDALTMVKRKTNFFKILGTYPIEYYSNEA